jgi:hypothetical protein
MKELGISMISYATHKEVERLLVWHWRLIPAVIG